MQSSSPIFLKPFEAIDVAEIARLCGGQLVPGDRRGETINGLSSLQNPKAGTLVFVQRNADAAMLARTIVTSAILCSEAGVDDLPTGPAKIVVKAPMAAFCKIGRLLYPDNIGPARVNASNGIRAEYPHAAVSSLAMLEDGVVVEPGAVIGDYAAVGRDSVVGANAVIADRCQIGRNCRIGPGAVLQYALIGNGAILHGGIQVGQDGFGFVPGAEGLEKVPQLGRVVIQDRVEIGANSAVDRGALDDTVIGEGTKIDNFVQIAHNVIVGRNCVIAAHTGVSGSAVIGDGCMIGGLVGIANHIKIGAGAQIAAASGVMNDVPDGERWAGKPAMPAKEFFRQMATLRKLARPDKKPKPEE